MFKRGLSIQAAFSILLVSSIVGSATAIGVSGYVSSRDSVEVLWGALASQVTSVAVERTRLYLENGRPALALNQSLTNADVIDPTDPDRRDEALRYLLQGLRSHPNVIWYSFASPEGLYMSAYLNPDGTTALTYRVIERPDADLPTHVSNYVLDEDDSLIIASETFTDYDPRNRGWWNDAMATRDAVWSEPLLFASRGQPGFMLVQQHRLEDDSLLGVWLLEYEVSYLSHFLAELDVVDGSRTYLIAGDGTVVGHPEGRTTDVVDEATTLVRAEDHDDRLLSTSYPLALELPLHQRRFGFEVDGVNYLAVYEPFPAASGLDWSVAVIIPEETVLGRTFHNNRITAIIGLLATFITIIIASVLTKRISEPLREIAREMEQIGQLRFDSELEDSDSFVREVTSMSQATNRMKGGLRSFAKYVPSELVRDLVASGQEAVLGGEQRDLTIFFMDLANFTTMTEKLEPLELVEVLARYLSEMSLLIAEHEGTVDKFIGDAVMAFWGAPKAIEDHAVKACQAALRCQERLAEIRLESENLSGLYARIGINTGDTVVGNIGAPNRMNYTVLGDTVNLASRIEGLGKIYGCGLLVGESTWREVRSLVVSRPIDKVVPKGKIKSVMLYELMGRCDDDLGDRGRLAQGYAAALSRYFEGDFNVALAAFEALASDFPDDRPTALMIDRCQVYRQSPPEAWDGVSVMTSK